MTYLNKFRENQFVKNIMILGMGTFFSQIIPLIFSPLLSRIYSPLYFGVFALISSISSTMTIFSNARIPDLISIPKSESEAKELLGLAFLTNISITFILTIVVFFFKSQITIYLALEEQVRNTLFLIPLILFFQSTYPIYDSWLVRKYDFKSVTYGQMIRSWSWVFCSIILGLLGYKTWGLLISLVVSYFFCFIFQALIVDKGNALLMLSNIPLLSYKRIIKKNSKVLLTLIVSEGIGAFFTNIVNLFISKNYGLVSLGFYSQASRLIEAPLKSVSNTIGLVFKRDAIKGFHEVGRFDKLFKKTFINLLYISILPFIISIFTIEGIITWFLGRDWLITGKIANITIYYCFFSFIFSPLDKGALIRGKNSYYFLWHLVRLILLILMVWIFFIFKFTFFEFVISLTIINSLMLLIDFYFEYKFSK